MTMDAVEDLSSILSIQTNYNTSTKILNIIRWVITAWHCVWAELHKGILPVWMVSVILGAHYKTSCLEVVKNVFDVVKIVAHPNTIDRSLKFLVDIALVKVKGDIDIR